MLLYEVGVPLGLKTSHTSQGEALGQVSLCSLAVTAKCIKKRDVCMCRVFLLLTPYLFDVFVAVAVVFSCGCIKFQNLYCSIPLLNGQKEVGLVIFREMKKN